MKFSEIFIKNPVVTLVLFLGILIFGLVAYKFLPIAEMPQVNVPVITINVKYPGASPEMMATAIANPIQNEVARIPGIRTMLATNTQGSTQILCTFDFDKTVTDVAPDVQNALWESQSNLPVLPNPPTYQKYNPSNAPILYIQFRSNTYSTHELYDIAYTQVARRINMVKGVSEITMGENPSAAVINLDPNRMASYKIGYRELANFLMNSSRAIPGGNINGNLKTWAIKPHGQLRTADEYNNLIVRYQDGAPIRVSDIGTAGISTSNDLYSATYFEDGKMKAFMPVLIKVRAEQGANVVAVAKRCTDLLEKIEKQLPKGMETIVLYSRAPSIIAAVNTVKTTMYTAFVLVCLVIFLFLGRLKDMIVPAIALPLAIIAGCIFMYILGFTLDSMSLMALTLAIGFCIDDAVVVLENTVRLIETGLSPLKAAIVSAKEITGTVLSMTLSLVTVFIPLIYMAGVVGHTFKEFALTVIITVLCSGIISLTLTPMMCARMLSPIDKTKKESLMRRFTGWFVGGMVKGYKYPLKLVLKYKYVSLLVWILLLLGTGFLYSKVHKGFLPLGDSGMIIGEMFGPMDATSLEMRKFQKSVNEVLSKNKNLKRFVTITGENPGADQAIGQFLTILKPIGEREPMMKVAMQLRKELKNLSYPLGRIFLMPMRLLKISTGATLAARGAQYSYTISGIDQENVNKISFEMYKELKKCPAIVSLQNSVKMHMPVLNVKFDRDKASSFGFNATDFEEPLYRAFGQGKLSLYRQPLDVYDIIMQVDEKKFDLSPEDLTKLYVKSPGGQMIPFNSFASWEENVGPQVIQQSQQLYAATLSFNLKGKIALGEAVKAIDKAAEKFMPPTMTGELLGDAHEFKIAIASMGPLVLGAIFLMYIILGILYKSFIHPITVISTLPVAVFGGLATLIMFNMKIDLYGYVGMFMLLGIIAKNGIMMVDFANQNVNEGQDAFTAIFDASIVRFRPILMTGVAAIMGAVPIALGMGANGGSRVTLGVVVVGGLIFSQIVTLFLTPPIYLILQSLQEKVLDKFELTRSESARQRIEGNK